MQLLGFANFFIILRMRKLIFGINVSLDGCCDHTKFGGGEDILEFFGAFMREVDLLVYGRVTYQLMVPYWPDVARNPSGGTKAEIDFAQAFDGVEKIVVFSRSLDKVEGEKTRIIRSDLREEILNLKQEPGKNISVGGVDLPSQLIELGLIDEFIFVVHPVIVGEGRRLFDGVSLPEKLKLKLAESKVLRSGCVALRYVTQ